MGFLPQSVRARLTLWYSVMLGVPLIAFAVVSYLSFSRALIARTDAFLSDALTVFANELFVERRQIPSIVEAIGVTVREVRFRELDIVVLDEEGSPVASSTTSQEADERSGSPPLPFSVIVEALKERREGEAWVARLEGPFGGYRVRMDPLPAGDRRFMVVGAYPLAEVEATLRTIRRLFLIVIPLIMVVAGTGGWFLARRSFWPVTEMADRAAEISASTLHERLPVVADDELGALARVLNGLLDRLERSFADQRRFMADASHELRSPTAILRTETDVTLSREHRTEAEYRESMIIVQDAAHRLSRVVDDLFLLARADGGHLVMQPNLLYLDEVVGDTVRAARPLAEQKGLRVEVSSTVDAALRGDTDLLGRLLLNLLDNAIRHSPEGGTVRVVMEDRGETVEVAVVDSGPGIPPEAQSHVFERFFRLDAARSRDGSNLTTGAGLGLAIGRRIAEMHGGRLDLTMSQPGRTEFRLTLPVGDLDASTMQEDPSRGG
jgi:two-component system OmpR family sensor kinase